MSNLPFPNNLKRIHIIYCGELLWLLGRNLTLGQDKEVDIRQEFDNRLGHRSTSRNLLLS